MHVEVLIYPGTGDFSEVHAKVEPVGVHDLRKDSVRCLAERHHLRQFACRQAGHVCGVAVGYDHQVSGIVGEGVQYDKAFFPTVKDEVFFVVVHFWKFTEDASRFFLYVVVRV